MDYITFIVHFSNGKREIFPTNYSEDNEQEVDAAWDYVRSVYPNAEYIEQF